jgi:hypothetical protein
LHKGIPSSVHHVGLRPMSAQDPMRPSCRHSHAPLCLALGPLSLGSPPDCLPCNMRLYPSPHDQDHRPDMMSGRSSPGGAGSDHRKDSHRSGTPRTKRRIDFVDLGDCPAMSFGSAGAPTAGERTAETELVVRRAEPEPEQSRCILQVDLCPALSRDLVRKAVGQPNEPAGSSLPGRKSRIDLRHWAERARRKPILGVLNRRRVLVSDEPQPSRRSSTNRPWWPPAWRGVRDRLRLPRGEARDPAAPERVRVAGRGDGLDRQRAGADGPGGADPQVDLPGGGEGLPRGAGSVEGHGAYG